MISSDFFWKTLRKKKFSFFAGVPCSILEPVLSDIPKDIRYVNAVREDAALGAASGASVCGVKSAILIQNSGLGNIINALTSFNLIYKIPVLLIITWRGHNGNDAPEHLIMGDIMLKLLKTMRIPHKIISKDFDKQLIWADKTMRDKKIPAALILKKGTVWRKQ